MANRPAGIAAMQRAFDAFMFDRELLRRCAFPVYYAYGALSHEEQALKAGVLTQLFADIHVQRFEDVHHFVPADRIYTSAHASALQELWRVGETGLAPELALQQAALGRVLTQLQSHNPGFPARDLSPNWSNSSARVEWNR